MRKLLLLLIPVMVLLVSLAFAGTQQDLYDISTLIFECDGNTTLENSTNRNLGSISGTVTANTNDFILGTSSCDYTGTGSTIFSNIDQYTTWGNLTIETIYNYSADSGVWIYEDTGGSTTNGEFKLNVISTGQIQLTIGAGFSRCLGTAAADEKYHSIVVDINKTSGSLIETAIFFDNVLCANTSFASGWTNVARDFKTTQNSDGNDDNSGKIDHISIFNRTLTQAEKDFRYNSGAFRLNEPETPVTTCDCPSSNTNWVIGDASICVLTTVCDIGTGKVLIDNGALYIDGGEIHAAGLAVDIVNGKFAVDTTTTSVVAIRQV